MPNNLPRGVSALPRLTSRKPRFAFVASAFPIQPSNTSPPTFLSLPLRGVAISILFLRLILSRLCRQHFVLRQSRISPDSSAQVVSCFSSPEGANLPNQKGICLGL